MAHFTFYRFVVDYQFNKKTVLYSANSITHKHGAGGVLCIETTEVSKERAFSQIPTNKRTHVVITLHAKLRRSVL